jgi:hypothetical protein
MGAVGFWHAPQFIGSSLIAAALLLYLKRGGRSAANVEKPGGTEPDAPAARANLNNNVTSPQKTATLEREKTATEVVEQASPTTMAPPARWQFNFDSVLMTCIGLTLLLVLVSAIKPPYLTDEVEYHWAAAVAWADAGHWIAVPFRYMSGPCLAEMLYLVGAVFHSSTAAHLTHVLFFVTLIAGCASLARTAGGSALAAAAGICATQVFTNQAALGLNDVAFTALSIGGLVALLRTTGSNLRPAIVAASIALVGAVSIKPFAFVVALTYGLTVIVIARKASQPKAIKFAAVVMLLAVVGTTALWKLHTKYLTGSFASPPLIMIPADQSLAQHQEAVGKWPSLGSFVSLPVVPFITPILGQQEPYGSRTGLIGIPFALLLCLCWKKMTPQHRLWSSVLLGCFLIYFFSVGAFSVRTRYLSYAWALLVCLSAIGVTAARQQWRQPARVAVNTFFCLAVIVGIADSSHVLLHWPGKTMARVIPQFTLPE